MSETTPISYNDALKELEGIIAKLRSDQCDIDSMVAMTRRAAELLKLCRERLTTTEDQLQKALADLATE